MSADWCGHRWLPWVALDAPAAQFAECLPRGPGFYRVRVVGRSALAYIGQTGRNLNERTRALARNAYRQGDAPPWNDPHTAAPGLWAWRVEDGLNYEVSAASADLTYSHRQCTEDMMLHEYRLEVGRSTLCNHGRFHPRWTRPSNRKRGVAMRRLAAPETNPAAAPSLAPVSGSGPPGAPDWLGLSWVHVGPPGPSLSDAPEEAGVYRLSRAGEVVYVGESANLRSRLKAHSRKYRELGLAADIVVMPGALAHHLKEREVDVIGAFYKVTGRPPVLQYRGEVGS